MTLSSRKTAKIIKEDVKERHTSHWDLDYLPREDFEKLMSLSTERPDGLTEDEQTGPDHHS